MKIIEDRMIRDINNLFEQEEKHSLKMNLNHI